MAFGIVLRVELRRIAENAQSQSSFPFPSTTTIKFVAFRLLSSLPSEDVKTALQADDFNCG